MKRCATIRACISCFASCTRRLHPYSFCNTVYDLPDRAFSYSCSAKHLVKREDEPDSHRNSWIGASLAINSVTALTFPETRISPPATVTSITGIDTRHAHMEAGDTLPDIIQACNQGYVDQGAFRPLSEQPVVRAILLPLVAFAGQPLPSWLSP